VIHASAPSPIGAVVDMNKYLDKHEIVAELKSSIVRLEMENAHLKENHVRELEQIRKDLEARIKEAQDSNAMFGQGISMLMQRMGVAD
jgi:exonuclease VII small subunit